MWNEFKVFVARGNVVDMAVGVVLGMAFGKIVTSLVSDILMPPVGLLLNEVDFSNLFIDLSRTHYASLAQAKAAGAATINYGMFVNDVINFLIVAWVMFWLIKPINRWKNLRAAATVSAMKGCPYCLSQIPLKADFAAGVVSRNISTPLISAGISLSAKRSIWTRRAEPTSRAGARPVAWASMRPCRGC